MPFQMKLEDLVLVSSEISEFWNSVYNAKTRSRIESSEDSSLAILLNSVVLPAEGCPRSDRRPPVFEFSSMNDLTSVTKSLPLASLRALQ